MKRIILAILALAIVLPACRKINGSHAINKVWTLENIDYIDSMFVSSPPATVEASLDLSTGSSFSGQGPINSFDGSYKALKDGQIEMTINNQGSTAGDSTIVAWENEYIEAIREAYLFNLNSDDTKLSISFEYGNSDEGELNFVLK